MDKKLAAVARGRHFRRYMLRRWDAPTRFLGDSRICITNNARAQKFSGFGIFIATRTAAVRA